MRWCTATTIVLSLMVFAAPARGGTYDVWGCRLPDDRPAAIDGWRALTSNEPETCAKGGYLESSLDPTSDVSSVPSHGWRFSAPADTTIDDFTLERAVGVGDDRDYHLYRDLDRAYGSPPARVEVEACIEWFDQCTRRGNPWSRDPANVLSASRLDGTVALTASLECHPHAGFYCPAAPFPDNGTLRIWSARIGLLDTLAPVLTEPPSGTLLSGVTLNGFASATFAATDRGGGIQTMGLLVDSRPLAMQPVDRTNAECVPPYVTTVPCRLVVQPTLMVDTSEIANGTHTVRVTVADVAGNQTQSDPFPVTTRNGGKPNGANATTAATLQAWFKSNRAHRVSATVGFNGRRTVEGRVMAADGRPIGAAVLQASSQAARPGSRVRSLGNVVTDGKGRFRFVVPRGSSRELHLGYRAFTLDEQEAASATLTLSVRAGVRLAVTPRRVRNGTTATFSGRLLGGPGQFGTQVTIYALTARRPIPVETVPADRLGRFRYRYRFSSIAGRGRFRFRAVVKSQPNYPYARGGSAAVTVRARP